MLIAKEKPGFAFGAYGAALFKECAKGCNACARADHNYGCIWVRRQPEVFGLLHENSSGVCDAFRQKRRANAFASALKGSVPNHTDREMHFAWVRLRTGRYGVEARLQFF